MLTRKQHQLLLYVSEFLSRQGVSPSFEEMKTALGLRSKSGIHRLITGLEERGFIRRLPHRARALEVLRTPDMQNAPTRSAAAGFAPKVIQGDFRRVAVERSSPRSDGGASHVEVPILGKIAAGTPIEALRQTDINIAVPAEMLRRGEYFALSVDGDSMVDAGILDGDTVILERCDDAETGAIVVAMVDGSEVTLKRLRKRLNSVALEPANRNYETRICGPEQVTVQGRLVGLIRSYH
ncbi:MAG: transcriptional repressor LexA [Alphaproteobacteria bacterium]|nr:transcriptional repressor LexA [Alphaproteobacteria bacterium]